MPLKFLVALQCTLNVDRRNRLKKNIWRRGLNIYKYIFNSYSNILATLYFIKRFGGDGRNIAVLLFLYILQGIPLGLAAAVPLILTNRKVSYKQQAEFSFAYWPFSVKLLWAPIVDSIFIKRFGRRKTWLVPVQYCIGITMVLLAQNVDYYLDTSPPDVFSLTCMFFFLNFLAATQVRL